MTQETQENTSELGNIKPTRLPEFCDYDGTDSKSRCRKWVFTLNNYTDTEYTGILKVFNSKKFLYIVGKEVGEIKGTPHLQGYIEHKNPISFKSLKKINNRVFLAKSKGSREQNIKYCSKEGNYDSNFPMKDFYNENEYLLDKYYKNVEWKEWQSDILERIKVEPDERQINWFWEKNGKVGKSYLCRYLNLKYPNMIICDGKKGDIFNAIKSLKERKDYDFTLPICVIMDIPRHNEGWENYGVIEQIKNGFVYSGKYEGGNLNFLTPHIYIFANFKPNMLKWSKDRYNIVNIDD